ncbi:hypothetical protein Esti_000058 [Eimeria stiedai]
MQATEPRPPSHGPPGSLAGGAIRRGGLTGSSSSSSAFPSSAARVAGRQPVQSRGLTTALVPEGLPARGVVEPLGSLAYLQHRSPFAFAAGLEVPLPALSVPPRLAAYPLRKRRVCGQPSGGLLVPSVVDVAAAQQLLTPFDASGLLPSLINPLGYQRMLLDPPLTAPPAISQQTSVGGGQQQRQQRHQQQQQQRAPPSADALRQCLEGLHKDDVELVLNVLPEIPDELRRSLLQPAVGAPATSRGAPLEALGENEAATHQQRQARGQQHHAMLRHPSKPHLTVKRPPSAGSGAAAGAERAVVLVVPPPASEGGGASAGGPHSIEKEECCLLLQLAGPRRVLLKAGASQRRPRVVASLGTRENETAALPAEAEDSLSGASAGEEQQRGRGATQEEGETAGGQKEEGRQLFTEEGGEGEEEAAAAATSESSDSSGSSSSSEAEGSASDALQGQGD